MLNNSTRFIPFVVPVAICFIDFYFNLLNFLNFQYTSDGLHLYSLLRNIIDFGIPYEGPRFEWLLGIHSYLTAIVFAIPIGIFNSPIVLIAGISILNFISCLYIIKIGKLLNNSLIEIMGPILFLALHFVRDTRNGTMYMFQPDWIAIPIVIALSYTILARDRRGTLLAIILLLLNKEEWIVQLPILLGFLYLVLDRKEFIKSNKERILIIYALGSMISLVTNFYFRSQNTNDYPVELSFDNALFQIYRFSPRASVDVVIAFAEYFLVLILLATMMLIKEKSKKGFYLLFLVLLITEFRFLIINTAVYKDPFNGAFFWSSHALVTPVMTIALLLMIPMRLSSKFDLSIFPLLISFIMLITPFQKFDVYSGGWAIGTSKPIGQPIKFISSSISYSGYGESISRFRCLQEHEFSSNSSRIDDYFISSHLVAAPFMENSHVPIDWALDQKDFRDLAMKSLGFVVSENDMSPELLNKLSELEFELIPNTCLSNVHIFERRA
jgi:hypothetical protein